MANKKYVKDEFEYSWKAIRDMANKGIGHSKLIDLSKKLKKKNKKK